MSEEDQAAVRAQALEVIKAYRDGGCKLPPPPSPETIHEMMCFLVGGDVPADYVPMMLEEMELDGRRTPASFHLGREVSEEAKQAFHVVVIGCGMSGLLAAIRLEEAGFPTRWSRRTRPSAAPGSRTPTRAAASTWATTSTATRSSPITTGRSSSPSAGGAPGVLRAAACREVRDPRQGPLRHRGGRGRLRRGGPPLVGAVRPNRRRKRGDAESPTRVISAVGQLNRPKLPDIPGRDSFRGPLHALGSLAARRRPEGQAGRRDRHRRQRASRSSRPSPPRRRAARRLPALRAVDVPQSQLPRARSARGRSGR